MPSSFQRLFRLSLLLLLFLLVACARAEGELSTDTPPEMSPALISTATIPATLTQPTTPTRKPTRTASPTRTRLPSITPGPTATPYPTRTPTFTPTLYDPANAVTRTPAPAALCPVENPDVVPVFQRYDEIHYYNEEILNYLNMGASRQSIVKAYQQLNKRWSIQEKDVTGDGVPEIVYEESLLRAYLYVYHCNEGVYELITAQAEDFRFPTLTMVGIKDLNMNGIAEMVSFMGDDRTRFFYVLEWDGSGFQQLNWDGDFDGDDYRSCMLMYGPSTMDFIDTDNNGTFELILHQAIPIWSEYIEGLPWREETRTCTWNGALFVMTNIEYAPPQYRFQAVQDADRASLKQEYDKALDLYQQAIFSDQLDWWSIKRADHERQIAMGNTGHPLPDPDPNEYFYLSAYARFRIMLLHLLRGYLPEAETVYNTLQEKFTTGQPGAEFAEMAAEFWNEYQTSANIGLACRKAIRYAADYVKILSYLGGSYHGWQSLDYEYPDVCHFASVP